MNVLKNENNLNGSPSRSRGLTEKETARFATGRLRIKCVEPRPPCQVLLGQGGWSVKSSNSLMNKRKDFLSTFSKL